jgi:Type II CAAX prenyl endopeptidase Rce1-like
VQQLLLRLQYYRQRALDVRAFLLIAGVTAASLTLNYAFGVMQLLQRIQPEPLSLLALCGFFAAHLEIYLLLSAPPGARLRTLQNLKLQALGLFVSVTLAVYCGWSVSALTFLQWVPLAIAPWFSRCFVNMQQFVVLCAPVVLFWICFDRKRSPLYGCTLKNYHSAPYLWMLIALAPFVFAVSFLDDFRAMYPRYYTNEAALYWGVPRVAPIGAFLVFYALGFLAVEFYFRGFMLRVFKPQLGARIILIAAGMYCLIHFRKPMIEAVSSFFGGLLLGVIAYYGRSIAGGVLAHLGLAFMMEAAGYVQIFVLNRPLPGRFF